MNINTRICTRCDGTGKHSFNLRDGDVCYGCGGAGKQIVTPKGQPKITPTATLATCNVGDIIEMNKVLARVTSIKWIELKDHGYNQVVRYTRFVDDKPMKSWRTVYKDFYAIIPSADMIGKEL
jgi:ribosomal protein L37E